MCGLTCYKIPTVGLNGGVMTQKRPKEERMYAIARSAVEEFLEKGYEGASMDSIARRAGLSKGGLYHHFKGKEEVLIFANHLLSEPIEDMKNHADSRDSAFEALEIYIRSYLEYWNDRPHELVFFFLSISKVLADRKLWAMYEEYTEQMIAFFQRQFSRGVETGEFRPHDSRAYAVALMSSLDGVIGYVMLDGKLDLRDIVRGFLMVFLEPLKGTSHDTKKTRWISHE